MSGSVGEIPNYIILQHLPRVLPAVDEKINLITGLFCPEGSLSYEEVELMVPSFFRMPTGEGRKAPEIHLGYFTRVRAVWNLLIRLSEVCHSKEKKLQVHARAIIKQSFRLVTEVLLKLRLLCF
jgi:hypothetical protein